MSNVNINDEVKKFKKVGDTVFNLKIQGRNEMIQVTASDIDKELQSDELEKLLSETDITAEEKENGISNCIAKYIDKKYNLTIEKQELLTKEETLKRIVEEQKEYLESYHKLEINLFFTELTFNLKGKDIILLNKVKQRVLISLVYALMREIGVIQYYSILDYISTNAIIILLSLSTIELLIRSYQMIEEGM